MSSSELPPGYVDVGSGGLRAFAWAEAADWAASVLAEHTLHAWAGGLDERERFLGRGVVFSIPSALPGPDGRARWAVRHYHRGGRVASLLDDRYLRTPRTRPLRELQASVEARQRGVPTPAVVAGAAYPAGVFYRADLVTELVPDAMSLVTAAFDLTAIGAAEALHAAGRLVALLEEARVLHADLNAGNILIEPNTSTAHVIDLDRALTLPAVSPRPDDAMRRRLERSLRKLERNRGEALGSEAWEALRAGYEASA